MQNIQEQDVDEREEIFTEDPFAQREDDLFATAPAPAASGVVPGLDRRIASQLQKHNPVQQQQQQGEPNLQNSLLQMDRSASKERERFGSNPNTPGSASKMGSRRILRGPERFHYDKATYTGTHRRGGPRMNGSGLSASDEKTGL